jgi:predicted nucleic acid-binding protein
MIVVDASLVVKLFREENNSDLAEQAYAQNRGQLSAPDLIAVEVAAALVRNANMHKPSRPFVEAALAEFGEVLRDATITLHRLTGQSVADAARMALDLGHPLKDCIYLALAMELGCDLVTCDAKFAAKAKGIWAGVRVLGE